MLSPGHALDHLKECVLISCVSVPLEDLPRVCFLQKIVPAIARGKGVQVPRWMWTRFLYWMCLCGCVGAAFGAAGVGVMTTEAVPRGRVKRRTWCQMGGESR